MSFLQVAHDVVNVVTMQRGIEAFTSSVDAESEQAIQQALKALTHNRTTIAIAHRLSTLRDANRILVFDRGQLAEQGTHEELLRRGGRYAQLHRLQVGKAEVA